MPGREWSEVAALFLRKARADLLAAQLLAANSDVDDGLVGFHAQQALEKAIKAVLVIDEVEIPHSHDLGLLTSIAARAGIAVPEAMEDVDWLNPWAVTMRYDELPEALDRQRALLDAVAALTWAESRLSEA